MTFCLDSIIIKPEEGIEIKHAIILLHGYGGDGKDISMLTLNWKRHMPNTVFICPNGHESCAINPSGFQWFDLTKDDADNYNNRWLQFDGSYIGQFDECYRFMNMRFGIQEAHIYANWKMDGHSYGRHNDVMDVILVQMWKNQPKRMIWRRCNVNLDKAKKTKKLKRQIVSLFQKMMELKYQTL